MCLFALAHSHTHTFTQVLEIKSDYPLKHGTYHDINFECSCQDEDNTWIVQRYAYNSSGIKYCVANNGTLIGSGCTEKYVPDVFLFSIILFFSTYFISIVLKDFKFSPFFPTKVRQLISDFSVVIAIIFMTVCDVLVKLDTPKLIVPAQFKVIDYIHTSFSSTNIVFDFDSFIDSLLQMKEDGWYLSLDLIHGGLL